MSPWIPLTSSSWGNSSSNLFQSLPRVITCVQTEFVDIGQFPHVAICNTVTSEPNKCDLKFEEIVFFISAEKMQEISFLFFSYFCTMACIKCMYACFILNFSASVFFWYWTDGCLLLYLSGIVVPVNSSQWIWYMKHIGHARWIWYYIFQWLI